MRHILLIFFILLVLGCSKTSFNNIEQPEELSADAKLIDSFLRLEFPKIVSNGAPIIIRKDFTQEGAFHSGNPSKCEKLLNEAKKVNKKLSEAVNDFCNKNRGTKSLETIGTLSVKHVLLSKKQLSKFYRRLFPKSFQKKYPGSEWYILLSRPGFSKDGTIAIIHMYQSDTYKYKFSRYYIMEKKDGNWIKSNMFIGGVVYGR